MVSHHTNRILSINIEYFVDITYNLYNFDNRHNNFDIFLDYIILY